MNQETSENNLLHQKVEGYLNDLIKSEKNITDAHIAQNSAQKNLFQKIAERMTVHQKSMP